MNGWRVLMNFWELPRSASPDAMSRQYLDLFEQDLGAVLLPVRVPKTSLAKRAVDFREPVTEARTKVKLYRAIDELAGVMYGEETQPA